LTAAVVLVVIFVLRTGHPSFYTGSNGNEPKRTASSRPKDVKAYIAYQKGRYLWNMRTAATVETSLEYFQQAVTLDPTYAPGYAGLADAYALLNFYTGRNRQVLKERAAAAAERALKLDESMAEAHATQAYIRFYYDWDWSEAESSFRRAISLNPSYATARQWYAEYLFYMGRFEEAQREINRAHELDPQSLVISLQLASPDLYSRNYGPAIDKIQEALKLNPDFPLGIYMLATCYEQLGRFGEALAEYKKVAGTMMGLAGLGYVYGRSGRHAEARQVLRQLLDGARADDLSSFHVARVYAGLGDDGQAFAWLKRARDARDERMVMVKVEPKLDTLRSSPLFHDLLQNLRLL
jgi:tetratricopeptide (TPR) repeat protein